MGRARIRRERRLLARAAGRLGLPYVVARSKARTRRGCLKHLMLWMAYGGKRYVIGMDFGFMDRAVMMQVETRGDKVYARMDIQMEIFLKEQEPCKDRKHELLGLMQGLDPGLTAFKVFESPLPPTKFDGTPL